MIVLSRRVAWRFHAAYARCVAGRPRGPAPPVVLRQTAGRVTLAAAFPGVVLELAVPGPAGVPAEVLVVPAAALAAAAGPGGTAEFAGGAWDPFDGSVHWDGPGPAGTALFAFAPPGPGHDPPPRPAAPVPAPRLVVALCEAGRTAGCGGGRDALGRVQVRGAAGEVVATDGRLAVVFGGFAFPFAEDVLVPPAPLFGSPAVRGATDVRVGRTPTHLVVSAGGWTAWLAVTPAVFPDVAAAVPPPAPTTVVLDPGDAGRLLAGLSGRGRTLRPVTLCADGVLAVRVGDAVTGAVKELLLTRSPVTGPAARVALDRRALARMLVLGCTALRVAPGEALVGTGAGVTVVIAPLDPEGGDAPGPRAPGADATAAIPGADTSPHPNTTRTVQPHGTNGDAPAGRHDPAAGDAADPLAAAEELRAALADAAAKAARLVTALKALK